MGKNQRDMKNSRGKSCSKKFCLKKERLYTRAFQSDTQNLCSPIKLGTAFTGIDRAGEGQIKMIRIGNSENDSGLFDIEGGCTCCCLFGMLACAKQTRMR